MVVVIEGRGAAYHKRDTKRHGKRPSKKTNSFVSRSGSSAAVVVEVKEGGGSIAYQKKPRYMERDPQKRPTHSCLAAAAPLLWLLGCRGGGAA